MNQELKEKWVAALRSGAYHQGVGHLCRDGAYCCWGVLRLVADPKDVRSGGTGRFVTREQMKEWGFDDHFDSSELERMNDGHRDPDIRRHSFPEIADYIEEKL